MDIKADRRGGRECSRVVKVESCRWHGEENEKAGWTRNGSGSTMRERAKSRLPGKRWEAKNKLVVEAQ